MVFAHKAMKALGVVMRQLSRISIKEGIELGHKSVEIPARTICPYSLVSFGSQDVESSG
jgi:hypothetical protein